MSLITQCPACHTLFKVVSDQLKISQGWVRCGQCQEVFDANAHWFTPAVEQLVDKPSISAIVEALQHTEQIVPDARADSKLETLASQPVLTASAVDQIDQATPATELGSSITISPAPIELPASLNASDHLAAEDKTNSLEDEDLASDARSEQQSAPVPSFVRKAQRAQRWRSPWVRLGLAVLGLLLMVLVALQVAVYERDRIAALQPKALPWLSDVCRIVGCSVGPLKHIESVVVESSSFNKIRNEGKNELYKVALNLKNSGTLAVAIPHIELSLNDSQDQTVLRRVLSPADLGALQFVLTPRAEFSANAIVQIDTTQLAGLRVAGYRIWAFYP